MPAQISALSARASTIAHSTSSGQAVAGGNSNSPSIVSAPDGGAASGGCAGPSGGKNDALLCPFLGAAPPGGSSARHACPALAQGSALRGPPAPPGARG